MKTNYLKKKHVKRQQNPASAFPSSTIVVEYTYCVSHTLRCFDRAPGRAQDTKKRTSNTWFHLQHNPVRIRVQTIMNAAPRPEKKRIRENNTKRRNIRYCHQAEPLEAESRTTNFTITHSPYVSREKQVCPAKVYFYWLPRDVYCTMIVWDAINAPQKLHCSLLLLPRTPEYLIIKYSSRYSF